MKLKKFTTQSLPPEFQDTWFVYHNHRCLYNYLHPTREHRLVCSTDSSSFIHTPVKQSLNNALLFLLAQENGVYIDNMTVLNTNKSVSMTAKAFLALYRSYVVYEVDKIDET